MTQEIKPRIVISRSCFGMTPDRNLPRLIKELRKETDFSGIEQIPHRGVTAEGYKKLFGDLVDTVHSQLQPTPFHFLLESARAFRRSPFDPDWLKVPVWYALFGSIKDPLPKRYGDVYKLAYSLSTEGKKVGVIIHSEELQVNSATVNHWANIVTRYIENGWGLRDSRKDKRSWHPDEIRKVAETYGLNIVFDTSTFIRARRGEETGIENMTLREAFEKLGPRATRIHFSDARYYQKTNVFSENLVPGEGDYTNELVNLLAITDPQKITFVPEVAGGKDPISAIVKTCKFIQSHIRR